MLKFLLLIVFLAIIVSLLMLTSCVGLQNYADNPRNMNNMTAEEIQKALAQPSKPTGDNYGKEFKRRP